MKYIILNSLFFFAALSVRSQISFTIQKQDVKCNSSSLGAVEVIVDPVTPPYTFLWNTGQMTSLISELSAGNYSVIVADSAGNDTTVSITVNEILCEMSPEIVFTPNGDGYNDHWAISNAGYFPNALILVYDRHGHKVYESDGLYNQPWEGKSGMNAPLPTASYFYILYQDRNDESLVKKGTVSIIR